jgi:hypothetical protein
MVERGRFPRARAMTGVACGRRRDVICRLALCDGAVVAHGTAARLHAGMREFCRCPCIVLVTRIALLRRWNMVAVLG